MFKDNQDFYPTPEKIAFRLLDMLDYKEQKTIKYILEPSAGKLDLVHHLENWYRNNNRNKFYHLDNNLEKIKKVFNDNLKIECIEIDDRLKNYIRGEGYNLVYSDFIQYEPQRFYDLILCNVPFSTGARHLLKAINVQERIGGKILCIINADTIKNTYSKERIELKNKLEKYNATIEYVQDAFIDAERKTGVEVALIKISVPMKKSNTIFEDKLQRDKENFNVDNFNYIVPNMNPLEKLVFEYELIKNSTIELFQEQERINNMLNGFGVSNSVVICNSGYQSNVIGVNEFINNLNLEYWNKFIDSSEFRKKLPSDLKNSFRYDMERQSDITFNMDNIKYFYDQLINAIPESYEKTCAKIFDALTHKYHYSDSVYNKNIWGYTGWKTNKAHKIVGKVIIPFYDLEYCLRLPDTLLDLNIIFNNIAGEKFNIDTQENRSKIKSIEKNIDLGHFIIDVYKKGTFHIKFKNKQHLEIFNVLAGKGKNALPSDFGTKKPSDMTTEEKNVMKNYGMSTEEYILLTHMTTNDYLRITG